MNLKPRFLLLAAALILIASAAAWIVSQRIARGIIEQWGVRVAEIQVGYDTSRLLQLLAREIILSRQLTSSPVIRRWARAPHQPGLEAEAIAEMERFRPEFYDKSYFVALLDTGAYYHNNANNEFAGQQLRYHLDPAASKDFWFYELIRQGRDFHLNVNPDPALGVTKVWIDMLIRDGETVLGVAGTGLELDSFLRQVVDKGQPGIITLFVDHNGAIQLYRDPRLIDYASIVKPEGEKHTIDLLVDAPADRARLRAMMAELAANPPPSRVLSQFIRVGGKRQLAGIAYLPDLDWYEITLLDLDVILPVQGFIGVGVAFAATLLIALLAFNWALNRLVLDPVAALEAAMLRVRDGGLDPAPLPAGKGEIGRLIDHFRAMAEAVRTTTQDLEAKVRDRTEALHHLARIDPLTELMNRRGMTERLEDEIARMQRNGTGFGILWVDLDNFKAINDTLGHAAGDRVLVAVAGALKAKLRPYDCAARWGGDEFLVLVTPCDADILVKLAERLRAAIEIASPTGADLALTASIGACLAAPDEPLTTILQQADDALYAAKEAGRNTVRLGGPSSPH